MKKVIKSKPCKIILAIIVCILVIAICYCAFILLSYHRIGNVSLEPENTAKASVASTNTAYTITSYNIGFGAYQQDYTCVLDTCYVKNDEGEWEKVKGKNLKAFSKEDAMRNTQGAADTIASLNPDFAFFQEADTKSNRCYKIDQTSVISKALGNMNSVFCINFDMPFLIYPINDMMGAVESGLLTKSKYSITKAERKEFEVTSNTLSRLFDLDRCFSASYVDVDNGKQLVLVNLHMSAYDKGGVIRQKQREQLYSFIDAEYQKGNYLIIGGDFNHDMLTNNPAYPEYTSKNVAFSDQFEQKMPDNVVFFFDDNKDAGLPTGFKVVAADNAPTCRPAAITWQPGFSYLRTLDAFIVSDNVGVETIKNIVTSAKSLDGFAYSDHEPVFMRFILKS